MKPFAIPAGYEEFVSSKEVLLNEIHRDVGKNRDFIETRTFVRVYSLNLIDSNDLSTNKKSTDSYRAELDAWNQIIGELNLQCATLSSKFRWQEDPLTFRLAQVDFGSSNHSNNCLSYIPTFAFAAVDHNDSIEDEYFMVFLLLQITKTLKHHHLCVQITDNDGEFLLIEAADYLDSWITPETSENRVWIMNGAVHIIPPEVTSKTGTLSTNTALAYFLESGAMERSLASASLQRAIYARTTAVFPEKIEFLHHNVVCLLPYWAAYLLEQNPQLLAKATSAFFSIESDVLSQAVSKCRISAFLNEHLQQLKAVKLPWTKAKYAQATFKKFKVPRKYHDLMRRASAANSTKVNKAFDLGCRILCGLDLLYQQSSEQRSNRSEALQTLRGRQQVKFAADLPEQLSNANSVILVERNEIDDLIKLSEYVQALLPNDAEYMDALLKNCAEETFDCSEAEAFEAIIQNKLVSDSEDWLYMEPEEFDKFIQETINRSRPEDQSHVMPAATPSTDVKTEKESEDTAEDINHLQSMVDGFKQFLSGKSDIEGVDHSPQPPHNVSSAPTTTFDEESWDDLDMNLLENTLQQAKLDVITSTEAAGSEDRQSVEATLTSTSTKFLPELATDQSQTKGSYRSDQQSTDSDDEDDSDDDSDADEEDSDEEFMFGTTSEHFRDGDILANKAVSDDEDEHLEEGSEDEEEEQEDVGVEDLQMAMDEELYGEAALLNTFANLAKLQEAMTSGDSATRLPMDMDGDDFDAHFLSSLLEAQAEGLGVPLGAFHQLFAQIGIQLPKPPPIGKKST